MSDHHEGIKSNTINEPNGNTSRSTTATDPLVSINDEGKEEFAVVPTVSQWLKLNGDETMCKRKAIKEPPVSEDEEIDLRPFAKFKVDKITDTVVPNTDMKEDLDFYIMKNSADFERKLAAKPEEMERVLDMFISRGDDLITLVKILLSKK